MIVVADESVDSQIVARLRQDGHEVIHILEVSPGISDEQVLAEATKFGALLLTADKDFGELVFRFQRLSVGVILIRLAGLPSLMKAEIVSEAFVNHATELPGAFVVISPGQFRVRGQLGS